MLEYVARDLASVPKPTWLDVTNYALWLTERPMFMGDQMVGSFVYTTLLALVGYIVLTLAHGPAPSWCGIK